MKKSVAIALALLSAASFAASTAESDRAVERMLNSRAAGSTASYAKAAEEVRRQAEKGDAVSRFVLAIASTDDDAPPAAKLSSSERWDYLDSARERVRQLAEDRDDPLAWYLLSIEGNDYGYLKHAADGGCVQAMNAIGTAAVREALAYRGDDTNKIAKVMANCLRYFTIASGRGDVNALFNLGTCKMRGLGTRADKAGAIDCFRRAAAAGHPEAMETLSLCHRFGDGVEKDDRISLEWHLRAKAASGDEAAAKWLRANGISTGEKR